MRSKEIFFLFFCLNFINCIRTGIYGGSFNPIHNGHIALARQMLNSGFLDEVWFVVSPLNPFKKEQSDLLSDELRLAVCQVHIQDSRRVSRYRFQHIVQERT